ncbi:zinc ribbon domain-containing protein [uncultured Subdoligranulum sp.]|uniref:zinc ribbon domain-containing protein n=1 Tax=uncultured Subdoligranulum sp. TaxID=512298 RepID=UPI003207BB18
MKRCPKCGAVSRRPGEKFCSKCGAPLSEVPPQAPGWPPESFVRRKRGVVVLTVAAVVVLILVLWVGAFQLFGRSAQPADAPATVTAESAAATAVPGEADRLYLENLTEVPGLRITVNGVETTFAAAEDGRLYLDRSVLTQTDTLLRAIQPQGDSYETSLALVSKPSNPTASFGTMTPCDAEGYNDPDEAYLDAMLSVYYRSQLQAFNSRKVEDLRFSSDLNGQSWEGDITQGAYDAVQYNLDTSDMTFSTAGLAYGDHKVTLNAAGQWTGVNRNTGETESGTDYMTIQAIWRDGIWQVDRCVPCSQEDYEAGVLQISSH